MTRSMGRTALPILHTPGMPARFARLRFADQGANDGTPGVTPAEEAGPGQEAPAQETDWKAEARKWEARSKANDAARKELDDLKAAQMSEAEKRDAALAAAQAELAAYKQREQLEAWRAEVSQESGVPAVALAGTTLEEIQAHAQTLKPLLAQQGKSSDDGKPHVPYRELSKPQADAPTPSPGMGSLRAAYAEAQK